MNKFKNNTKQKIQVTKLHVIPRFPTGLFALHIGDHLRSSLGIISGLRVIYRQGSFAALYCVCELGAASSTGFLETGREQKIASWSW